jgi:hypothetical protein
VAETETLDLVWLSTTRVHLFLTRALGGEYVRDITAQICAGLEIAMTAAWEGKGDRRPRPTVGDRDASLGSASSPTRTQQRAVSQEEPQRAYDPTGGGSPSLTSEEQEESTGSRAAAAQDRRVQETTERLLAMEDSPHLPTAGQWSASSFQQQVYWG